jgi:hypothetical protein
MQVMIKDLPPKSAERFVRGTHEQNWIQAIKTGGKAGADFSYSGPLTEICLLGNIAKRVDTRIQWDAAKMKIANVPAANKYLRTRYRDGWSL